MFGGLLKIQDGVFFGFEDSLNPLKWLQAVFDATNAPTWQTGKTVADRQL